MTTFTVFANAADAARAHLAINANEVLVLHRRHRRAEAEAIDRAGDGQACLATDFFHVEGKIHSSRFARTAPER